MPIFSRGKESRPKLSLVTMETLSSIREEFKRLEILIFYSLGVLDVGKFYEATFMD